MPKPVVLLTNPIHEDGVRILERRATIVVAPDTSAETINTLAREAQGIIVRVPLPPDVIDHAPSLVGVVRHGAGLDMIPVAAATARRIPVAYVPGANAVAVAEYCFAAMLQLARRLSDADRALRTRDWQAARSVAGSAIELSSKTLGIVGLGNIGRRVAAIGNAFGMEVAGVPHSSPLPDGVRRATLSELFRTADVIVLSCPLTVETRGLVDGSLLGQMKRSAYLINVSRGAIVDEKALAEALRENRLGGAALDVFSTQPLPADHPFRDLPNVLLTPHLAGLTVESLSRMSSESAMEMIRILDGERPAKLANPEVYDA